MGYKVGALVMNYINCIEELLKVLQYVLQEIKIDIFRTIFKIKIIDNLICGFSVEVNLFCRS